MRRENLRTAALAIGAFLLIFGIGPAMLALWIAGENLVAAAPPLGWLLAACALLVVGFALADLLNHGNASGVEGLLWSAMLLVALLALWYVPMMLRSPINPADF